MHKIFEKKQILTVPNLLSLVRLLLIPVIIWLYLDCGNNYAAIAVIALSGLTDVINGKIARKYNLVSDFGKILDPVADKLTQGALILCLTHQYSWMLPLIIFFAVKEIIMATFGFLTIRNKDSVNSAQWHGKLTTVMLYSTMILLILFPEMPVAIANTLIAACGCVMLLSLILYARFYVQILREGEKV